MQCIFLDLETTGLNAASCSILQIAAVVVDLDTMKPIHGVGFGAVVYASVDTLQKMEDVVLRMHATTGLLWRVQSDEAFALGIAEHRLCEWATQFMPDGPRYLAGDSIHFDRRFIQQHMPSFDALLHHRMIDVSTLRVLAEAWGRPAADIKGPTHHDAVSDVECSIAKLAWHKEHFKNKTEE